MPEVAAPEDEREDAPGGEQPQRPDEIAVPGTQAVRPADHERDGVTDQVGHDEDNQ
ncbi:hypothetical protein ACF08O_35820 [Streptomyces paradoxus]|uniref:hypothetical protein n=1 Tax=Streptomyces paradoxus TaxID=66375 RepID=UPI0037022B41